MTILKCKMCGGALELKPGETVAECPYCGTKQTVPLVDDDKKTVLYERANRLRASADFDRAFSVYEGITQSYPRDAEAFWGELLCKYGIEYVDDPATGKKIPTCHRSSFTSILEDEAFEMVMENCDPVSMQVYRQEAKQIEEIRKGIIEISSKEPLSDVFICYKETDENGDRTIDSVIAQDVYNALIKEGYKVFFSRISLEDKLGKEYEPYIFSALNSAKVMLVFGTKYEYFNAVWVKNEWSRYLHLISNGENKTLIPCYRDVDVYDMPKEFQSLQSQNMSKVGAIQDLVRGIGKLIRPSQLNYNVNSITATKQDANPLLKRVFIFLEDGNFKEANEYCEKVLDMDPENASAYLGKLMAELRVKKTEDLKNCLELFDNRSNYQKAVRFGDEKLSSSLKGYITYINERNEKTRVTGIYNNAVNQKKNASTENEFKAAAELFSSIPDYQDAKALAEECLIKAEESRKNAVYYSAQSRMHGKVIRDYEEAICLFTSISDWKDASAQIDVCRETIEKINKENEEEQRSQERLAEERRIAAEEKARKHKRMMLFTAIAAVAVTVVAVSYVTIIKPRLILNEAMGLLDSGQYDEAYAMLNEIGKDEIIVSNKYERALALLEAGQYDKGYELLNEVGKSEEVISSKYDRALTMLDNKEYEDAYILLNGLNYKDSEELATQCFETIMAERISVSEDGLSITFGCYEQDGDTENGAEKITWQILAKEGDRFLVISTYGLDSVPYNTKSRFATWETCSLRNWLNYKFINTAFTPAEQAMILTTKAIADKNPDYGTDPGNDTEDKIFLLSIPEIQTYFRSDSERTVTATVYAKNQGADVSDIGNSWWWLRSPGDSTRNAVNVGSDGSVNASGRPVGSTHSVVRPAFWVRISNQ